MLVTSIFSFSHNVIYPINQEIIIVATLNLLSENTFNLVQSKNLSLGKELKGVHTRFTTQSQLLTTLQKKKNVESIVQKGEKASN